MIRCEINATTGKTDEDFIKKIIKGAFKILKIKTASVSIAIVDSKTIRKLNKTYRRKDKTTDVLSFKELNEIIIEESETKDKKNLKKLLIHGILHLLGYEHEKGEKEAKKMFKLQEKIIGKL